MVGLKQQDKQDWAEDACLLDSGHKFIPAPQLFLGDWASAGNTGYRWTGR